MVTVDASCPVCGKVTLRVEGVTFSRPRGGGSGGYSFRCPRCGNVVDKPANGHTLSLLAVAGAQEVVVVNEAMPARRALTGSDLANALALLDDDDRFAAAVAKLAEPSPGERS